MMKRRELLALLGITGVGGIIATQLPKGSSARSGISKEPSLEDQDLPQGEPRLRFVSVGDTGTGNQGQYAVAKAMTQFYRQAPYPLVLLLGDNIYNNGEIEKIESVFQRPYQPLLQDGVNFYACLGNHDIRTENGTPQVNYPQFNMGGRYYTFTRSIVQFFALDTNPNADWEAQLDWLDQALRESSAPWKIVFGHHNLYSSGVYGKNEQLISKLTPILEHHNVPLYINGHEHHYERTQPIDGTTYLTCGSGAKLRPVEASDWTAFAASELSFAVYEVYADELVVRGINQNGELRDRALISRLS